MSKSRKKAIVLLIGILTFIFTLSVVRYSPEYMYRILRYGESDVNDYRIFPGRTIENSVQPYKRGKGTFRLPHYKQYNS